MTVTWRGADEESQALADAIQSQLCLRFWLGRRLTSCPAHRMLVEEQRVLDGLLFARRIATRLQHEEWSCRVKTHVGPPIA